MLEFTVTEHFIIRQLAIFGIEDSKFKVYAALKEQIKMVYVNVLTVLFVSKIYHSKIKNYLLLLQHQ